MTNQSGFCCLECGHSFRTVKAAQKAAYSDAGCPNCGGSDIDLAPVPVGIAEAVARARGLASKIAEAEARYAAPKAAGQ
jgi:hypothetical protein